MVKEFLFFPITLMLISILLSCKSEKNMQEIKIIKTILVTSEAGDKLAQKDNVKFKVGKAKGNVIKISPQIRKQTIDGIGSSFTESSALVLAHLQPTERKKVMEKIFSETGANFSLTRTHIGACDFCVEGKYSYLDNEGDVDLKSFSIAPDNEGFSKKNYNGIEDEGYDLLPMIKEALSIKQNQKDNTLRIVSSAWTAPPWMKNIEDWYITGTKENNFQGTGGSLKLEYEEVYADYLIKYLESYKQEGIDIWGLTPVNEPHGNNGQWESMHFTPKTQNEFIKKYLGPKLQESKNENIKLLIYDQNRDGLEEWTNVMFNDSETKKYIYGVAVHWYEHTEKVYEDIFEKVNSEHPDMAIVHTEGCIDDLGKDAPQGITDPEKFKEKNWFNNDSFWWNDNATDWGYSAEWQGVNSDNHPIYTPVHRYARNIIVSIDNWLRGWIDWNVVLDHNGGPNHVGNYCGAPIMINTETKEIYYTPIFHVLSQLSRTIRPGDVAVQTEKSTSNLDEDALHACATLNDSNVLSVQLLNTTKESITYNLQIAEQFAEIKIDANSVQTVQVEL